jgi:hypothetical protein
MPSKAGNKAYFTKGITDLVKILEYSAVDALNVSTKCKR